MDIGDFIGVEGIVFTTKTGEISVHVENITILSKSIRPLPIVKEKDGMVFDAFSDKEQRYRNRHLDLILNPKVKETFFQRAKIIKNIRKFLDEKDFLEVETQFYNLFMVELMQDHSSPIIMPLIKLYI